MKRQVVAIKHPVLTVRDARMRGLVNAYSGWVWTVLRRFWGLRTEEAEDMAQEVFIVAAQKFEQIAPGSERAYLYGIIKNVARNHRRKSCVRLEVCDPDGLEHMESSHAGADQQADHRRLLTLVDEFLQRALTEEQREVFVLSEIDGMTCREIGSLTDTNPCTVASRLNMARKKFNEHTARLRARGVLPRGTT